MILTSQIDLNCAIEESRKRLNAPFKQARLAAIMSAIGKAAKNKNHAPSGLLNQSETNRQISQHP